MIKARKRHRDLRAGESANPCESGLEWIRIRICITLDLRIDANPGFARLGNPSNSGIARFVNMSCAMRKWVYMRESGFALDSRVVGSRDLQGSAARTNEFAVNILL